jgi:serine/threonine protein kinase/predicted ATPase
MGVVYEAYDRDRETLVALKTIRKANPETIYLFKQEFRLLAKVAHPNLIPLYELVSDGEQWFFTMELLKEPETLRAHFGVDPSYVGYGEATPSASPSTGESMAEDETVDAPSGGLEWDDSEAAADEGDRSTRSPHTFPRTVDRTKIQDAFVQLAEGVIALHEVGVLHRDLKPENVLVRNDGRVVLLDFGLVQELGSARAGTGEHYSGEPHDRRVTGSAAYMSPEQAAGEALTAACDWYAVGVMLYEILTAQLPIQGRLLEILRAKQVEDPVAPKTLAPGIPEDLSDLCMDLLDRDPSRRPGGPEVVARLRGIGDGAGNLSFATAPAESVHFVGRKRHLETLDRCFAKTEAGATAVCRVVGSSGAGKSALIDHFLTGLGDRAEPVVLVGRCYEQESVPYKAVDSLLDALTRYLLLLPPEELKDLIPGHAAALARVFPTLRRIELIEEMVEGHEGGRNLEELRGQAFGALRELLNRIGDRSPLVLYIDDLQWGDLDSAALISDILCSQKPPGLLMIFCYRTEYVGVSPCLRALEGIGESPGAGLHHESLEVDALSTEEARELALALLDGAGSEAEAEADWVVEESGGSALFIYELAQHLEQGMDRPDAGGVHLDGVLWQRIQRLPDEPRQLLEAIAVASRPILLRHAQEAARLRSLPPEVVGLLRAERLVKTTGPGLEDQVESYHDRIRESIVARLPESVVRQCHASLAASLESDGEAVPDLLAAHLEGAGETERAGLYYKLAAEQAAEALAFDRAEELFQRALKFASGDSVRAQILERMVHFYTDLARFEDAYRAGREGAALFGVRLPARFHPPSFLVDLIGARLRLGRRDVSDILEMPRMNDERLAGAVRLIAAAAKAAYQMRPELCVAVNAKMVKLCLRHGNTVDSAIGYMVFGCIFLGGILGQYRRGYEFGRLALDLVERYENRPQKAEVNFVVGYFGTSWVRPAKEAEELWRTAHSSGLETGDLFHTGCASCATILGAYMRGEQLDEILEAANGYLEMLDRVGLREPAGAVRGVRQAIRNLRGETRGPGDFSDADFDETAYVETLGGYGSRHFAHYYFVVKMQAAYLWGDLETALETAEEARSYLKDSAGMLHSAEHRFYEALILAAEVDREVGGRVRTIRKHLRLMRKWAALCPENFRHKERLVAAELARIRGDKTGARKLYREARESAAESAYPQVEALAYQLSAGLENATGAPKTKAQLEKAAVLYRRWGATAYAEALDRGSIAFWNQSQ